MASDWHKDKPEFAKYSDIHHSGASSPGVAVRSFSQSIMISVAWQSSGIDGAMNSRHAPQGGTAFPSLSMAITRLTASSPFVIMLKTALRSAHTPNQQAVSTQTPAYILPDADSTAATPPASMILEISRGFNTCLAALYNSFHSAFIDLIAFANSGFYSMAHHALAGYSLS